jgi:hypothetical protein
MIGCWSTKGGSGTTVISAALALTRAKSGEAVRLVDACGDLPAVLGISEPDAPGLSDWFASSKATANDLAGHFIPVAANVSLLPRGSFENVPLDRDALARLSRALQHLGGCTIVDFGRLVERLELQEHAIRSILVVRPCYLALRRASQSPKPDSIIVVEEPSRALRPRDVEQVIGARIMASVPIDPTIARCVDAGLLATQLPPRLVAALDGWS